LRLEEAGELEDGERTTLLRALHTLKGNSGMLGLHAVVDAVHAMETAFKSPGGEWPRETVDLLFEAAAAMRRVADRVGSPEQQRALERLAAVRLPPAQKPGRAKDAILPPEPATPPPRPAATPPAASGDEPLGSSRGEEQPATVAGAGAGAGFRPET
jgi:chemotaxis protein histidine kinase CheA